MTGHRISDVSARAYTSIIKRPVTPVTPDVTTVLPARHLATFGAAARPARLPGRLQSSHLWCRVGHHACQINRGATAGLQPSSDMQSGVHVWNCLCLSVF
jgi:hypothetical protein